MPDDHRRLLYQYFMGYFEKRYLPLEMVDEDNYPSLIRDHSPDWAIDQSTLPEGIDKAYYMTLDDDRAFSDLRLTSDKPQIDLPDIFQVEGKVFATEKALDVFTAHAPDAVLSRPVSILGKDGKPRTQYRFHYLLIRIEFKFDKRDRNPRYDSNINPTKNAGISLLAHSQEAYKYVSRFPFWLTLSDGGGSSGCGRISSTPCAEQV